MRAALYALIAAQLLVTAGCPKKPDAPESKGQALAPEVRSKLLAAINGVEAEKRLLLLGAALDEEAGPMYGADLKPAFKALTTMDPAFVRQSVVQALQQPLVGMGCAGAMAEAIKVVPAKQATQLAAGCPGAGPRLLQAAAIEGARVELVMLALILEHRARRDGLAADPLHRKAVEILQAAR
jgi:hypothetical protein